MALAKPVNPRKKFAFKVEFDGLEPALVQRVKIPKLSIDSAEHGSSNILIKTAGMVKIEDIELNKLMFQNKNDSWAKTWMSATSDIESGTMGVPSDYKRSGYIIALAPDMETILQKWQLVGCWPKEREIEEWDASSSDNILERIVLSVDWMIES